MLSPSCKPNRWLAWCLPTLPILALLCLYLPGVYRATWLGMDDIRGLRDNLHLGSWSVVKWAVCTGGIWQRYMPLTWLMFSLAPKSAEGYRALALCLGCILSMNIWRIYTEKMGAVWGTLFCLLFVVSPMRREVFGWEMGTVYLGTSVWLSFLWLARRSTAWVSVLGLMALLSYPQASGVLLVFAGYFWLHRERSKSVIVCTEILGICLVDVWMRHNDGLVHQLNWTAWIPSVGHYWLTLVLPFATTPIFPAMWYPATLLGVALLAILLAARPIWAGVGMLVLAPTLAASVTEPYWFGARYSFLFSAVMLWFVGGALAKLDLSVWRIGFNLRLLTIVLAGAWFGWTISDRSFTSPRACVVQTMAEAKAVGIPVQNSWYKWENF